MVDMEKAARVGLKEALATIPDGATVALGGLLGQGMPMALVHELIRQKKRGLTLVAWECAPHVDMLVACEGLVSKVIAPLGEGLPEYSPALRRAVERGAVSHVVRPAEAIRSQLRAGIEGAAFTVLPDGCLKAGGHPDSECVVVTCPFTNRKHWALPALAPDAVLLHLPRSDRHGTLQAAPAWGGAAVDDLLMARAARQVVAAVEQIVSDEAAAQNPGWTLLPAGTPVAVAEAPYGAYPAAYDGHYRMDEPALSAYTEAAATQAGLDAYIRRNILDVPDWDAYLESIGTTRLLGLTLARGKV